MALDVSTLALFLGNIFYTVISPNPVILSMFFAAIFAIILAMNRAPGLVWAIIMIPLGLFIAGMSISNFTNMTGSAIWQFAMAVIITVLVVAVLRKAFSSGV